jgi:hypothetical protein
MEIKDRKLVPVGSPIGQNEPSVPIGSHTQPSEQTAHKNRITSLAMKRTVCVSLGKDREKW